LYIDDLVESLVGYAGKDNVMAYADDIAIIFHTKDILIRVITMVESWCPNNFMKVNKDKCGILYLQNRRGRRIEFGKEVRGYPVVVSYKYLGIILDDRLNFS
jgi:hypothetical protein